MSAPSFSRTTSTTRRRSGRASRWRPPPPPPPTPNILHLQKHLIKLSSSKSRHPNKLRSLFIQEKTAGGVTAAHNEIEKWKKEAERLREECRLLRMERDAALQKLQKSRERKKIDGTDSIEKKMGKLKLRSEEAAEDEQHDAASENREISEPSSLDKHSQEMNNNVEMLKRKMEGISKGMIERLKEYRSFFFLSSDNTYSNDRKRADMANQKQGKDVTATGYRCCCNCKEIVRRITEEVKAENKQWTEMQQLLDHVRLEMEHLKSSRGLWQRRAIDSEVNFRALYPHVIEWKRKARASEQKTAEMQKHIFELEKSSQNVYYNNLDLVRLRKIKCQQQQQQEKEKEKEKEKHVLVCREKNPKNDFSKRLPFQDITNLSSSKSRVSKN